MINSFQDLLVWKKSHELCLFVYRITDGFPKSEEFSLKNQTRRSAVSVPSNIAEGFRRRSKKDGCNFYSIAQGSLEELRYQVLLGRDLGYVTIQEYNKFVLISDETGKLINGWIKSQNVLLAKD